MEDFSGEFRVTASHKNELQFGFRLLYYLLEIVLVKILPCAVLVFHHQRMPLRINLVDLFVSHLSLFLTFYVLLFYVVSGDSMPA